MSDGWGQDFDEDGNVVGEMPERETGFFEDHRTAVIIATLAVLAINSPRIVAMSGNFAELVGGLIGGAMVSAMIGIPLAYVGVKLRSVL